MCVAIRDYLQIPFCLFLSLWFCACSFVGFCWCACVRFFDVTIINIIVPIIVVVALVVRLVTNTLIRALRYSFISVFYCSCDFPPVPGCFKTLSLRKIAPNGYLQNYPNKCSPSHLPATPPLSYCFPVRLRYLSAVCYAPQFVVAHVLCLESTAPHQTACACANEVGILNHPSDFIKLLILCTSLLSDSRLACIQGHSVW